MPRTFVALITASVVALGALLSGCGSNAGSANPDVLKFGVPPGEADPKMLDQMQPVADQLGQTTGKQVEVTKTSDYLAITEAMRSGLVDVALFSPMPTVVSRKVGNVEPIAVALGAPYTSSIICRPSAGVKTLADVASHSTAFVDAGSTSGNYIPRLLLKKAGVDVTKLNETFAGGHDVAALSVKQGSTDCAAVATKMLDKLTQSGTIAKTDYQVVATSDPIPISIVMIVRKDLDPKLKEQITRGYLAHPERILEITGAKQVVPAAQADWRLFEDAATELGIELGAVE